MKCNRCRTDYINSFETVKVEGVKYKVYVCPCCEQLELVAVKKSKNKI